MKSLGQSAMTAVTVAQQHIESAKAKGTAIALPPREKPLSVVDFGKLEAIIERDCTIKQIKKSIDVPKKDHDGYIYAWDFDVVVIGLELIPHADVDHRLVEAVQRPATPTGAIYHFTRLAAIKRNTRGDVGFQIALEDLAYDLRGRSEWAIMKACEFFRAQPSPFFPDHSEIMAKVEFFDKAAQSLKIEGPKS